MATVKRIYLIILCFGTYIFASAQMNAKYAARVGGVWSGSMKKGAFLAQMGVEGYQKITSDHWESISVDSFTLSVVRETSFLFAFKNVGNVFNKDLLPLLKQIMPGDKILIFDIYSMNVSRKEKVFLQPLEYLIE